jgi:hypothetical protein
MDLSGEFQSIAIVRAISGISSGDCAGALFGAVRRPSQWITSRRLSPRYKRDFADS